MVSPKFGNFVVLRFKVSLSIKTPFGKVCFSYMYCVWMSVCMGIKNFYEICVNRKDYGDPFKEKCGWKGGCIKDVSILIL